MLKDKYRPSVDVACDGIRLLTLEALSDMEITKKRIEDQGFAISCDMSNLDETNISYLPMLEYLNLLNERPNFVEQLVFKTYNNWCSFEELQLKIQKSNKTGLQNLPELSNRSIGIFNKNKNLFAYICAAYLRKKMPIACIN